MATRAAPKERNNFSVMLSAAKTNGYVAYYADGDLMRSDHGEAIAMAAVDVDPLSFGVLGAQRDNIDVVLAAVCADGRNLQFASPRFQDDATVVVEACMESKDAFKFASKRLQHNKLMLLTMVEQGANVTSALEASGFNKNKSFMVLLKAVKDSSLQLEKAASIVDNHAAFLQWQRSSSDGHGDGEGADDVVSVFPPSFASPTAAGSSSHFTTISPTDVMLIDGDLSPVSPPPLPSKVHSNLCTFLFFML
jgi:hypothetical protein